MNKILVPIDFSPASLNASEYAASLALAFHAEMNLLYVYMNPAPAEGESPPWYMNGAGLENERETQLLNQIETLHNKYLIRVSGEVIAGFKVNTIRDQAEKSGSDLIVMGLKAARRSRFAATTILKAVRKTSIPVLIVPEGFTFRPLKNIILAIDFDVMANERCFDLLYVLVQKFNASLRLLHVEKKGAGIESAELDKKLQMDLVLSRLNYVYDKIEEDDVVKGIHRYVQNRSADTLVMVAHPHNIIQRLFEEVHTRAMLMDLKLPLLALKNR